jgi:BlaI family penicillinase repressor
MENLTAKEEEIMQVLWDLKKALVRDIMERLLDSKQPYTTISSIVRILEKKGFVSHKPYGKTHEYYPLISKADYRKRKFKRFINEYFDNSMDSVVSFLIKEEKLKPEEIEELTRMIGSETTDKKQDDSE